MAVMAECQWPWELCRVGTIPRLGWHVVRWWDHNTMIIKVDQMRSRIVSKGTMRLMKYDYCRGRVWQRALASRSHRFTRACASEGLSRLARLRRAVSTRGALLRFTGHPSSLWLHLLLRFTLVLGPAVLYELAQNAP